MILPSSSASSSPPPRDLKSEVSLISERQVAGFVLDPEDLDSRFVVELLLDGYPASIARASLYDHNLCEMGFGDGCYRFLFTLEAAALKATRLVEVRLANLNRPLGSPILIAAGSEARGGEHNDGEVRWIGGLRFTGRLDQKSSMGSRTVKAFVEGALVAESIAAQWTNAGVGQDAVAVPAFDLHLPGQYADGRVRQAHVVDDTGRDLPGSPCNFVAFENGLSRFLEGRAELESEILRGWLFDQLIPQSAPFAVFDQWASAFPLDAPTCDQTLKVAVALVGETDLQTSIESLEAQTNCQWIAGAVCGGDGQTAFDNENLGRFLSAEASDCEIIVFALSGTAFHLNALSHLANAFASFPASVSVYSDITIQSEDGKEWPIAFPAFDYERTLEQGYGAFLFAMRMPQAREAAAKGASDLFRLFNILLDKEFSTDPTKLNGSVRSLPIHAPGFLARIPRPDLSDGSARLARATAAHLKARGISASARPAFGALLPSARVQRNRRKKKVSILIPTRDRVDLLRPCLDSLRRTINLKEAEVIVIDNDSSDPETASFLAEIAEQRVRVAPFSGTFNFSRMINSAASIATGEFILLLNNDVEAISPGWLDEMMSRIAEPDVGAVGATLLWPSRVVQHGGVVLGLNFAAGHAFNERIDGDPGYADLLNVAHECSAVTAACLLTRRKLFLDVGGLDGVHFPVNFNDVDFCLRLRALGYRIVFAPHAKLLHRESASRGRDINPDASSRFQGELRNLRSAWGEALLNDPFYNPMLSLDGIPFSALAWPPRSAAARQPRGIARRPIPPGF
jgi:O-antigen biosynthesis protein